MRKRIAKTALMGEDVTMRRWHRQVVIGLAVCLGLSRVAFAALGDPSSNSTNYQVIEGEIGGNGQFNSNSLNYNINPNVDDGGASLGESTVGNGGSTNYQTNSGFNTTAQPGLTMIVNTGAVNFGTVTLATKMTQTATFSVKNYTSYGYVVQIIGSSPTQGSHQLTALTTDTAYNATVEQFGLNSVLNTVTGVGANPVQNPSGPPTFGYGVAGDGSTNHYVQSDKWRFNSGEIVASAPKSSGETDYTLTFMLNAITTTPGGSYQGNLSLVATGTY
ncbi:MAG TPA: hypothetical protein VHQ86_02855 [Candidatus Saccharimonadia bacterium]|jgi:hypothetical protein|nr:hypothetical protein [Candidatus Saccharimonadia bacterium]